MAANSLPVSVALCDDNKDTSSSIMELKHIQGPLCTLSPRMALSAVNILHLNGLLEAKQTQTGLHTNDQWGPGVRQGHPPCLSVYTDVWESHRYSCLCVCVRARVHIGQE